MIDLAGKCALLVGARRVGGVVAERLAQAGVNLAIAYRGSEAAAESLRAAIAPRVARSCVLQGDVAVEADAARLVAEAATQLGGLHFVVNLASEFPYTPLDELDGAAWDRAMAQAKGSYLLALHAARRLRANPGPTRGHIVLFGDSAAGATPYRGYLPYLTAKAAIQFLVRGFAVELGSDGILVNAIAPGPTMRPPDYDAAEWQRILQRTTPLRRESSAAEIAEMILTLLRSETVTGECIRIDSGTHVAGPYELE